MATKKPSKSKVRKLTVRKETLKDLAPHARRAGQVKGGGGACGRSR
jgi:hypothetical protein